MKQSDLINELPNILSDAANSINESTSPDIYWHTHCKSDENKDQVNESNLTIHFTNALTTILRKNNIQYAMYHEARIGDKWVDCMIFIPRDNHIILIETKHWAPVDKNNTIDTDLQKLDLITNEIVNLIKEKHSSEKCVTHLMLIDSWQEGTKEKFQSKSTLTIHDSTIRNSWKLLVGSKIHTL